jgi:hypothetical protein
MDFYNCYDPKISKIQQKVLKLDDVITAYFSSIVQLDSKFMFEISTKFDENQLSESKMQTINISLIDSKVG